VGDRRNALPQQLFRAAVRDAGDKEPPADPAALKNIVIEAEAK